MTTAHTSWTTATGWGSRLAAGIIGGIIGGVMFGVLMQMMDMITMVAMLVGSRSPGVGWLLHLVIAAFIGATSADRRKPRPTHTHDTISVRR